MFDEGKTIEDEISRLKEENIQLISKMKASISHELSTAMRINTLEQAKFDLMKLIERNQLAWDNSIDNSMGCLPEVCLANRYIIEKWKRGEVDERNDNSRKEGIS